MVTPSVCLVLILTYFQVFFLSNVEGLTLPLKTVTKCESFAKKSPNPLSECTIIDNLASESSNSDKPIAPLLPADTRVKLAALESAKNGLALDGKEISCITPVLPKNPSSSNACASGFKSSLSVSTVCSNSEYKNLNSGPANPSLPSNYENRNLNCVPTVNQLPANLELASQSPILQSTIAKQDSTLSSAVSNQMCSSNVGPNLSITQSCLSNVCHGNLPLSQTCTSNIGSSILSPALSGPSNNLPLTQSYAPNVGSINSPITQTSSLNIIPNTKASSSAGSNSISSNSFPVTSTLQSNSALNNLPLAQSCPVNTLPISQESNNLPGNQGCLANTVFKNALSLQTEQSNIASKNLPISQTCSSNKPPLSTGYSNNIINNDQSFANANCGSMSTSLNTDTNLLPSSQQMTPTVFTQIPVAGKPLTSTLLPSPSFQASSISSASDSPINACNTINRLPDYQNNQSPLFSDTLLAGSPLSPKIKGAIIYPTLQIFPPPGNIYPIASPLPLSEQIPVPVIDSSISNTCPLPPPIHQTSVNEYFKGVKAATSKLNDFISSFTNKFGIKSFPAMQSYSSMPCDSLSQSNTVTSESPEDKCESLCPSTLTKPVSPQFTQECLPVCSSLKQNSNQLEAPIVTPTQASCDSLATSSPTSSSPSAISMASSSSSTRQILPSVTTLKAPIVPKTIVSSFNYPIGLSSYANNFQDSLTAQACIKTPCLSTNLPSAKPFNFLSNLNCDESILSDVSPLNAYPNSCRPTISSIIKSAKLTPPSLPNPVISAYEDKTSLLIPDILSTVLPKRKYPCESCKKILPFLSSVSINNSPNCDSLLDCATALSSVDECVDLSAIQHSSITSDLCSPLDESQLDECCKNLENVIAMLELSLSLNGGYDCNLDSVPDILSTL